jgi:glycosyltransferase involved in cell wall biosynthesis
MSPPFRIALFNPYDQSWVAGTEYIRNIIFGISGLEPGERNALEIRLITRKTNDDSLLKRTESCPGKIHFIEDILGPETFWKKCKWKTAGLVLNRPYYRYENFLKIQGFDFIYPYVSSCNDSLSRNSAAWIFDFQHKYLPKNFSRTEILLRDRYFDLIARYASNVVLSSRSAQDDFHTFFPQAAHKSTVLSFKTVPAPEWFEGIPADIQKKYSLPERFFIVSNQIWQHKNHLAILEALHFLKAEGVHPIVVWTGQPSDYRRPGYYQVIVKTIREYQLEHQVLILGLIPKIDQMHLMRRSIAVIQPSLFEGWSTVVEEARCIGKPIILSDIPVHIEQNPPNSEYFDHTSSESLAQAMAKWWKALSPGPNAGQEATAREKNRTDVREFAKKFLEIAGKNH